MRQRLECREGEPLLLYSCDPRRSGSVKEDQCPTLTDDREVVLPVKTVSITYLLPRSCTKYKCTIYLATCAVRSSPRRWQWIAPLSCKVTTMDPSQPDLSETTSPDDSMEMSSTPSRSTSVYSRNVLTLALSRSFVRTLAVADRLD